MKEMSRSDDNVRTNLHLVTEPYLNTTLNRISDQGSSCIHGLRHLTVLHTA